MVKGTLFWATLALALGLTLGTEAQAQFCIDSLTGPVTQHEIDCFRTTMAAKTPIPDNTGNRLAHHTSGQQLDALGLMADATNDRGILDIFVNWADTALNGRNDPNTGCIAWTGNRELFWPVGVRADGTCTPSTDGEQGYVMGHILFCALVILQNPSIWNTPVAIGDQFGFGTTYLQRAQTYVQMCDQTEDTFILPWFVRGANNEWRFPDASSGYDGSGWFGLPFPWNQQWMLNQELIRSAQCHAILGDAPDRIAFYDSIVQHTFDWWLSSDVTEVPRQGQPAYIWHYVNQEAPNHAIEDTGHAQFDMWGLWLSSLSGRYTISDSGMIRFANTARYSIYRDSDGRFAQRIDGSGNTQSNLYPQFLFLAKWIPELYGIIANADLPNAVNTAIYDAGILWVKNARYSGTFPQ